MLCNSPAHQFVDRTRKSEKELLHFLIIVISTILAIIACEIKSKRLVQSSVSRFIIISIKLTIDQTILFERKKKTGGATVFMHRLIEIGDSIRFTSMIFAERFNEIYRHYNQHIFK